MTFHLRAVAGLIRKVRASGLSVPILVGGYPFNRVPDLWKTIGADGSARDASEAVRVAAALTAESRH